jgi:hypothetical protein
MGVTSRAPILGSRQSGLTIDSTSGGIALTVPASGNVAEIYVETAPIRFTRDGTAPTTTLGFVANVGDIVVLNSRKECTGWLGIEDTATDASVEVEYFTDVSG